MTDSGETVIGLMEVEEPRINRMLNRLDPTTFPRANQLSPFLAATKEVASSGRDVPIAIIVNPIRV